MCALLLNITVVSANEDSTLIPLNFGFYDGLQTTYHSSPYKPWLHAALKQEGYRPKIHWLPGRRILNQVNNGILDGDLLRAEMVVKNNFPSLIKVNTRFGRACYAGYGYQKKQIRQDRKLHIGSFEGLLHVRWLAQKHWYNSQLTMIKDPASAVKMLAHERLDFMLLPPGAVPPLEQVFQTKLVQLTPHIVQFDTYMFLNPRHRALAKKLAVALKETKPAGIDLSCPSP